MLNFFIMSSSFPPLLSLFGLFSTTLFLIELSSSCVHSLLLRYSLLLKGISLLSYLSVRAFLFYLKP